MDEDGFLALIRDSKAQVDTKSVPISVVSSPVKNIVPVKQLVGEGSSSGITKKLKTETVTDSVPSRVPKSVSSDEDQLWTVKYRPKSYADVIGNKGIVDKIAKWLREWYWFSCTILVTI